MFLKIPRSIPYPLIDISDEGSSKLSTQLATSNINTAIEECPSKRARISCTET